MSESVLVQIDCGSILLASITPYACKEMALQEGDTVYLLFKNHAFHFVDELGAKSAMHDLALSDMSWFVRANSYQ